MVTSPLTVSQSRDLARYFLGPGWSAVFYFYAGREVYELAAGPLSAFDGLVYAGPSWRSAFRAAGVKLPSRPQFASVGRRIMAGNEEVATCRSGNFAVRTANALNCYEPNSRGQ